MEDTIIELLPVVALVLGLFYITRSRVKNKGQSWRYSTVCMAGELILVLPFMGILLYTKNTASTSTLMLVAFACGVVWSGVIDLYRFFTEEQETKPKRIADLGYEDNQFKVRITDYFQEHSFDTVEETRAYLNSYGATYPSETLETIQRVLSVRAATQRGTSEEETTVSTSVEEAGPSEEKTT